jgi:hypothetical protein
MTRDAMCERQMETKIGVVVAADMHGQTKDGRLMPAPASAGVPLFCPEESEMTSINASGGRHEEDKRGNAGNVCEHVLKTSS